jgi:hypothetical protein
MAENDADRINPPYRDSGDSTTSTLPSGKNVVRITKEIPIALTPNNRVATIQMVANRLLADMRHSTETYYAYCRFHKVICYQEIIGGRGPTFFDANHDIHFKPFNLTCGDPLPIPRDLLFQMCDMENPKLGEWFNKILDVKEALDEHARNKQINEARAADARRRRIQE